MVSIFDENLNKKYVVRVSTIVQINKCLISVTIENYTLCYIQVMFYYTTDIVKNN